MQFYCMLEFLLFLAYFLFNKLLYRVSLAVFSTDYKLFTFSFYSYMNHGIALNKKAQNVCNRL